MARVAFTDFNKRLFVAGGRDQAPDGTLRRARGVAPELTGSVQSMFPPLPLYGIKALNLIRFNGQRYQFDGTLLYKNGVQIASGFNGNRAALVTMPPNLGLQDYLFVAGAGNNVKIAPDNTVSNWGINQPLDQMTAVPVAQDIITVDNFDSHAANWTTYQCAVSNDNTEFQFGTGSMKIVPSASPWFVKTVVGYPKNFAVFSNNDISLPSDLISIWVNLTNPLHTIWMWLMFDVNDGTFKKDYYLAVIQLVQATTNSHAAGANATFIIDADRWMQIAVPKSSFQRIGTKLNLDWSNVVAVRIEGGALTTAIPTPVIRLDQFQIIGGSPVGIGPQAISPEHGSEYNYYSTFLNLTTRIPQPPGDLKLYIWAGLPGVVHSVLNGREPTGGTRPRHRWGVQIIAHNNNPKHYCRFGEIDKSIADHIFFNRAIKIGSDIWTVPWRDRSVQDWVDCAAVCASGKTPDEAIDEAQRIVDEFALPTGVLIDPSTKDHLLQALEDGYKEGIDI